MVKKLIVLGIDGMDWEVIEQFKEMLPNIYALMQKDGFPQLRSVFPADTTPAWSTIYTGLDPSEHGIINFVNVGAKENKFEPLVFNDTAFKGRTFWDVLNQQGISCAVILPMNIKQGWEIDGLMITRPHEGKINVYPESRRSIYNPHLAVLGTENKFTSENSLPSLRDQFYAKVYEEIRLTNLVIENEDVDVLFSYFSTMDGIQHDFWRHGDPKHPQYPGPNEHENVIRDMYIRMDEYVGELMLKQPDTPLLIISDHGHGARPVYLARVNELLYRGGYLMPKKGESDSTPSVIKRVKKVVKKAALGIVRKIGLPGWAMRLAKKYPVWKSMFASASDFDWNKTRAYLSDLSALKNYSYGGIRLNDNIEDKDALADEIIEYLRKIKIDGEDKFLFEWIVRTNTFYHGQYLSRYPEIIYQMDERYGAEWELGKSAFEKSGLMYILSPGGHRWRTAVIVAKQFKLNKKQYEMTDIYGLILTTAKGDTNG